MKLTQTDNLIECQFGTFKLFYWRAVGHRNVCKLVRNMLENLESASTSLRSNNFYRVNEIRKLDNEQKSVNYHVGAW